MTRYRIVPTDGLQYKVQYKGWVFWHDHAAAVGTKEAAKAAIDRRIKYEKDVAQHKKQGVEEYP